MKRKVAKFVLFLVCVCVFFKFFLYDDFFAKSITYSEFKQMLTNGELERVVMNEEKGSALLYAKEENKVYKVELFSLDKIEGEIIREQENGQNIQISIEKKKIGFGSFLLFFFFVSILLNVLKFVFDLFKNVISDVKKVGILPQKGDKKKNFETCLKNGEEKDLEKSWKEKLESLILEEDFPVQKINDVNVKFSDVIGLDTELKELKDIVSFLHEPERYTEMGAKLPKGVLLYGKSGVGKTLIAKAIAGEASVPFFAISASEVHSKFLGRSEENIRKLFKVAKAEAPSIIFVDELDSIATKRYQNFSNSYAASFLNQFLSCMDGFEDTDGVIIIATTNHLEQLDEAVLRSGRFDRQIYIPEPKKKARAELFAYYARNKKLENANCLEKFYDKTTGFTGADIEKMMNEAAILAVRNDRKVIKEEDLEEVYRKILLGISNEQVRNEEEKKCTAVHEAGHAVISRIMRKEILEISIISRGKSGGYNLLEVNEEQRETVEEILKQVKISLGGRAAERIVCQQISEGASADMKNASRLLYDMYMKLGMGAEKDVHLVLIGNNNFDRQITEKQMEKMEQELERCYQEVVKLITENQHVVQKLAHVLCEKETLNQEEIEMFFAENPVR